MSHTVVKLDSLPVGVREKAVALGKMQGPTRLEISLAGLNRAWRLAMVPNPSPITFPGITVRSELDQAMLLTICESCPRNRNSRCSLCKACGGGIPVADWVKLSTHRCPDNKW